MRKYSSILNSIIDNALFYVVYTKNKETKYIIETNTDAKKKHDYSLYDI